VCGSPSSLMPDSPQNGSQDLSLKYESGSSDPTRAKCNLSSTRVWKYPFNRDWARRLSRGMNFPVADHSRDVFRETPTRVLGGSKDSGASFSIFHKEVSPDRNRGGRMAQEDLAKQVSKEKNLQNIPVL